MRKKEKSLIWILLGALVVCLAVGLLLDPDTQAANLPAGDYQIQISEICAKNETVTADNDGKYRDYIELYNPGPETDLTGCRLTDGSVTYRLEGLVLGQGEYRLLFLGADLTGFALSSSGRDSIQLQDPAGNIISQAKLRSVNADQAMILKDGTWLLSDQPTPGFSNDSAGLEAFTTGTAVQSLSLELSEILIANRMSLPDEKGIFSDVVELHNPTQSPIRLGGWSLSDSVANRFRYRLPELTIPAGGYLLIHCDGENHISDSGIVHANFALTAQETLCLTDPTGAYVTVTPQYSSEDLSLALTENGYQLMASSLGFANTEQGCLDARQSRIDPESPLVISELVTGDTAVPYGGAVVDAVELWNRGDKALSTAHWYLSDGSDPYAYPLPAATLAPGERTVLVLSQQTTGFALSREETLYLMSPGYLYSQPVACSAVREGLSISLVGHDAPLTYDLLEVSLGFENTQAGARAFQNAAAPDGLRLSEAMSANGSYLAGPYGNCTDWVELYNAGSETVRLSDYYLTDSEDLRRYPLPDQSLAPGAYTVILLSETGKNLRSGYAWLPFSLSADGDRLYLTKDGKIQDCLLLPQLSGDTAWGRPNGQAYATQLSAPTPGKANAAAASISQTPTADLPQGAYDDVKELTVTFSGPGQIYYTTDCTAPTQYSKLYTDPITITATTVFRVASYEPGCTRSQILDLTYLVNEEDSLSTVCLVTSPGNLWDYSSGIYATGGGASQVFPYQGANYWKNWEKSASVSLFEADGSVGFSEGCGIKIFGGYSRANNKKSLACMFRSQYGTSSLDYPLFGEEGLTTYQNFVLRAGGQNAYASRFKDEVITSLASDHLGIAVQRYRPVALYLNGEYWGIYFIREKLNDQYVAGHYNTFQEDVTLAHYDGSESDDYVALRNYARSHDLQDPEHYEYICSRINEENYIDYFITQMWINNTDLGNVKFFKTPTMEWHWALFDTDLSMREPSHNSVKTVLTKSNIYSQDTSSRVLLIRLMKNPQFQDAFLRRAAWQLKTVWNEETVNQRIDYFQALLEKDIQKDCSRWGTSLATYEKYVQEMRDFAAQRNRYFVGHLKNYFGLTNETLLAYGFEV